jgi:phosphoribosylpyrophosphate synthetase
LHRKKILSFAAREQTDSVRCRSIAAILNVMQSSENRACVVSPQSRAIVYTHGIRAQLAAECAAIPHVNNEYGQNTHVAQPLLSLLAGSCDGVM